ncbi:hypothetical protein BH11BAC2_BH11BAC2_00590 [soil metagenome]
MSNQQDFKALWNQQDANAPDIKALYKKANQYKRKSIVKLVLTNILLIATSLFIGSIWYYFQPEMTSTKIGIILIIVAMVLYLAAFNLMIPLLNKIGSEMNAKEYLQKFQALKQKQIFLQTTMMNLYFFLLSLGLALYMYEYAVRSLPFMIVVYALTFTWIGISWFYLRPKKIKSETLKLEELLHKFERINEQFKGGE